MTRRIFNSIFIVAVSVFIASSILFMSVLYDYFSFVQHKQMRIQTDMAGQGVLTQGISYFDGIQMQDYRITWIGTDGSILYDSVSPANEMENHFEREEVQKALAEGYGESSRHSSTLTEKYLYSAKKLSDGTVIRLAVTQNSLLVLTMGMLQPIIFIFVIAVALSVYLAYRLSKNIVKPLNELNLDEPSSNIDYNELSPLLHRIETQQCEIKWQKRELKRKQSEFDTVTNGMTEGIVLLNQSGTILSINRAAAELLNTNTDSAGKDIYDIVCNIDIADLLHKSQSGVHAETIVDIGKGKYQFDASPVSSNNEVIGTVLLLFDVTDKERNEQIRREFTANVSHELKTPLQTISGCAELLLNGIVKNEDIKSFSKQIYSESQRMIHLVDDIIKLSRLDEGAYDMKREFTDLYSLANDTIKTLAQQADDAQVKIDLHGEPTVILGIPQLISSIIFNLCDNAIKYNRKGGSVTVTVSNDDSYVKLAVSDTGIGIPKEHQERIFERFYRVDKSHSKNIGGTGLGLSIVKHAARLHDADIMLVSAPDEGTTITISFPKKSYKP